MAFHDLCEALETLLVQHEQLLTFAQQKKEALISNDVSLLTEMVNKESRLVKLILETEARRQKAVAAFLVEKGLGQLPDIKVTDLTRMITNAEEKLKLSDLAERLIQAVERLKALNNINVRLTQQSIEFNDFSLSLLTGIYDDQDFVYKKPSDLSQGQLNLKFFDSKA
ncbi:flagellar protein FlgN [Cohnella sp.]|uniref:flagellar protein FlgN n=1 Tax=Cohnella sp. TaxID=1883426 RepID=UPI0035683452